MQVTEITNTRLVDSRLWDRLEHGSRYRAYSASPHWLISVCQSEPSSRVFAAASANGSALAALGVVRSRSADWICENPGWRLTDLFDIVATDSDEGLAAWINLVRVCIKELGADVLLLRRIPARSLARTALAKLTIPTILSDAGHVAYCDVSSDLAATGLSRENLRNVDRLRRRAEREYAAFSIKSFRGTEAADAGFQRFCAVEGSGWKGEFGSGSSLDLDEEQAHALRSALQHFGSRDAARVDLLEIGNQDAAGQVLIREGGVWFVLKIGFNPVFRAVGPGAILLRALIDEAIADSSVREVNLTTNPAWAARWHFSVEPTYNAFIFSPTIYGSLRYAEHQIRRTAGAVRVALSRNPFRRA